jgi:hypothetical protein
MGTDGSRTNSSSLIDTKLIRLPRDESLALRVERRGPELEEKTRENFSSNTTGTPRRR